MSTIIEQIASQYSPPVQDTSNTPSADLDKQDFLNLLVSQLQYQDPLNPQDPTEFTSQLTQYSSLEQLINLNTSFEAMADVQGYSAGIAMAGFIGKEARVSGDQIVVSDGEASSAAFELSVAADITLEVYDSNGDLVEISELGNYEAGDHDFTWDATNEDEDVVADGNYHFVIKATDASGSMTYPETSFVGVVESMRWSGGIPQLSINGDLYQAGDLIEVRDL